MSWPLVNLRSSQVAAFSSQRPGLRIVQMPQLVQQPRARCSISAPALGHFQIVPAVKAIRTIHALPLVEEDEDLPPKSGPKR